MTHGCRLMKCGDCFKQPKVPRYPGGMSDDDGYRVEWQLGLIEGRWTPVDGSVLRYLGLPRDRLLTLEEATELAALCQAEHSARIVRVTTEVLG